MVARCLDRLEGKLSHGSHVVLQGLKNEALNGSNGTAISFDNTSQRWRVRMWLSGQVKLVSSLAASRASWRTSSGANSRTH
mmetsp:Transcript_4333/g.10109  ORF Transcript_4333/g.10109 Transcript_4333/m.10109 type:complete len:81 (-) Transcript_4333:328-570(-)